MKQTAIQQAIAMVRSRQESIDETLIGKHTIHHLQQVERLLYELLQEERDQIENAYTEGVWWGHNMEPREYYKAKYENES
jgi:hypothetical protein